MKAFISILFIFILIFSITFTSAYGAAAAAAASAAATQQQAQQQVNYQSVNAPFDFAKNNSCVLKYPSYTDKEVGKYLCESKEGVWTLRTDGKGGVTESYFISNKVAKVISLGSCLGFFALCILAYFIASLLFKINNRGNKK